jgi:FkbM family methyltransferase
MLRTLRAALSRPIGRLSLLTEATSRQAVTSVPDLSGTEEIETEWGMLILPSSDEVILPALRAHLVWEPGETALIRSWLRAGMTFLDIGAHVGYYTLLASKSVGSGGLVIAFEPSPRNYELLLAMVWRNQLTNVVCFPWAVGADNRFVDLYLDPTNTGDNRVFGSHTEQGSVVVRMAALDALRVLRPPIDVVKMDVQGFEPDVVRGMQALLAASPRARVVLEYWPFGLRALGHDEREVLDYYRSLGYQVQVQNPEQPGIEDLSDDQILEYCSQLDGVLHTNLVLTRP